MGIGGSDGAFYEDDFDRLTGNDGNKPESGNEGSKGSRAPSDVSITFRGPSNPSGDAASGSKRTPLDPNTPGVVNPDLNPNLDTKDWNERTPDTLPAPQDVSGKAVPISNVIDRRDQSAANVGVHFLGESLTPGAAEDLIRNPAGQAMIPNSPLGEQLGMKDLPEPGQSWVDRLSVVNAVRGMGMPNTDEDINLLKGFYNTVKQAFKLPGEVFAGKVDPMSQQGIERSADLAGLMVGGPAPVAAKMADGTLGSFAGVRSLAGRTDDVATSAQVRRHFAERMEQDGAHPDDIWNKTGWMRGPEGKWKYEIDDSKAKFDPHWNSHENVEKTFAQNGIALDTKFGAGNKGNTYSLRKWKTDEAIDPKDLPEDMKALWDNLQSGMITKPLSEILDHPDLYKAYPELKDVAVVADKHAGTAYYDPVNGDIHVNTDAKFRSGDRAGQPVYNTKDILLHEIQHAIQDREGFAMGGASGRLGKEYKLKLQQAYDDFMTEAKRRMPEIDKKFATKGALGLSNEDMDFIHQYSQVQSKFPEYVTAAEKEANRNYMRLAGEIESRNTEARSFLTAEERRKIPPSATVEPEYANKQAVFTGGGRWATPYGYLRGSEVAPTAPSNITNFRRAANDNFAEGDPRRPYNIREPDMIGDSRLDAIMERDWDRLGKEMKVHEERQKKENETLAKMKENGQKLDDLHKGRDYLELNEFERARSDKLRKQFEDLSQSLWDPNKT